MKNTTIERIMKAMGFSCEGIRAAFINEPAFRQELLLCLIAAPIAFIAHVSASERALLIGSLFLILIVELVNSGIEAIIDRISEEIHPLSKRAKDIGSATVLLSLLNAGCIWLIIFWG